jgi:F0F1-type ATP synthase assembly protein I
MGEKIDKEKLKAYARFSTMVIQMGVTIGLGAWFGKWLDEKSAHKTPVWTVVFSLLAIGISLYLVIREVIKKNEH